MSNKNSIPAHVAVIMDGNGRWAKKRLMPRSYGHNAGMKAMIKMAEKAKEAGVQYLTVYALSTENLQRPPEELQALYALFNKYFEKEVARLYAAGADIKVIGDITALPEDVQQSIARAEANAPKDAAFHFFVALNYGARAELARAVNTAVAAGKTVTESELSALLYTGGAPDPDLIIRTGGEKRLSNFLLYQAAYAELYFTDVLFPDFSEKEFEKALADYAQRTRRFGKV